MSCFFEIFSKVFGKETSAFQFNFTPPPPSPSCHAFLRFFLKFLDLIANTSICCWCCKAFPESSIPYFSRGCSAYNFLTSRICCNTMQKFVLFLLGSPSFISSKIFIYFFCFFSLSPYFFLIVNISHFWSLMFFSRNNDFICSISWKTVFDNIYTMYILCILYDHSVGREGWCLSTLCHCCGFDYQ